jgi:hypothetical protein
VRTSSRLVVAGVSAAVLTLITGCGGSSKPTPSAPPSTSAVATTAASTTSPTPPPSSPDPTAQAKSGALDAYKKVVDLTTGEFATDVEPPGLRTYATDAAYYFFRKVLTLRSNDYVVYIGTPQSSPTVTDVKMDTTPHIATITDCFGGPNYKPVFATDVVGHKKGDSALAPGSKLVAHLVTATMRDKGDHWQIIDYTVSDKTC